MSGGLGQNLTQSISEKPEKPWPGTSGQGEYKLEQKYQTRSKADLCWWIQSMDSSEEKVIFPGEADMVIFSDASLYP
jgi:hypothetical protein